MERSNCGQVWTEDLWTIEERNFNTKVTRKRDIWWWKGRLAVYEPIWSWSCRALLSNWRGFIRSEQKAKRNSQIDKASKTLGQAREGKEVVPLLKIDN